MSDNSRCSSLCHGGDESVSYTHLDVYKRQGVENVYMPMFIPESLLQKEKDHVCLLYTSYTGKIRSALSEVSDISDVGMPDSNGVFAVSYTHLDVYKRQEIYTVSHSRYRSNLIQDEKGE